MVGTIRLRSMGRFMGHRVRRRKNHGAQNQSAVFESHHGSKGAAATTATAGVVSAGERVGTQSWIFRYMRVGKSRDMGLGPLQTVGLALARDKATQCRQLLLYGIDPKEAAFDTRAQRCTLLLQDPLTPHGLILAAPLGRENKPSHTVNVHAQRGGRVRPRRRRFPCGISFCWHSWRAFCRAVPR